MEKMAMTRAELTDWMQAMSNSGNAINYVGNFIDSFAKVQRVKDKLFNFIDANGNYLFKSWFNYLGDFQEELAVVERSDNLFNYIDRQGNYLSDVWFEWGYSFHEGFARVRKLKKYW